MPMVGNRKSFLPNIGTPRRRRDFGVSGFRDFGVSRRERQARHPAAKCQSLAALLLVCQTLATSGCATEKRMDSLVAQMGAAHVAALARALPMEDSP